MEATNCNPFASFEASWSAKGSMRRTVTLLRPLKHWDERKKNVLEEFYRHAVRDFIHGICKFVWYGRLVECPGVAKLRFETPKNV